MFLLQKSMQGAVMILAITVIRALLINKLPKKTFLILWGAAVFCLLFPLSLESRFSVYSLAGKSWEGIFKELGGKAGGSGAEEAVAVGEAERILAEVAGNTFAASWPVESDGIEETGDGAKTKSALKSEMASGAEDGLQALTENTGKVVWWRALWLAGFLLCAGYFGGAYLRCRRAFATSLPVDNGLARDWLNAHPLRRKISIRQSGGILAPLTYGIFSPVILMPKGTKWEWDGGELGLCLAHEFVHIRRFDAVTKLVLTAVLCIHWFNPMVWVMYVLANRDLELSCDEAVVRSFGESMKSVYARTLIHMEEGKSGFMPLCNNFSKNAIEERITAIMKMKKLTVFSGVAAAGLVVGITLAFATSAAGGEDAKSACVKEFLGNDYSQEEREKLTALWFDDYESMTVADFQQKAWIMRDAPEYYMLEDRLSNTAMAYERQQEGKEERGNAFWEYFYYVYEPLTAEKWQERTFGGYVRKDLATEEHPDFPKVDLEYFLTLSVLKPEELTVKEYYNTRLGVMEELGAFWQAFGVEDFAKEEGMKEAIDREIKKITDSRSSEKLTVSIDYFYNPLDTFHSYLEEEEKKTVVESLEAEDSYEEENRRKERGAYGTRADYDSLLALKTKDYESMTLADFNAVLLDWCNQNYEAMERTGTDAFCNDYQVELTEEEKKFAALSVQLSREENSKWVKSLNSGKPEEDPWWGGKKYTESYGDMWCTLYFQFSYHITDKSQVTVGERDRCVGGMMERILKFWEETELEERIKLSKEEVVAQFEKWAEECSSELVTIEIHRDQIQYEWMDEREYAGERVYLGTVSAEGSLRHYVSADGEGKHSKYFHLTVTNQTEKDIAEIVYSISAYDNEGRPLEVYWNFMDSSKPASYVSTVTKRCSIRPGETLDDEGGWSIMDKEWGLIDLSGYGTDYEVTCVLSCISQITFEDGTVWDNPDYEKWKEECVGKTVPYSVFGEYSQREYEIFEKK